MDLADLPLTMIAIVTLVGALLGGAIAHWRRGSSHVVTGVIIGGCLSLLLGVFGAIYSVIAMALAFVALVVIVVLSSLFG